MATFDPSFTSAVAHFEFLGFKPSFDEIGATLAPANANKPNLRIYPIANRVTCLAPFVITDAAKADVSGFCEFLNRVNATVHMSKFYLFETQTMLVHATYIGQYEKIAFGSFVDLFLEEIWHPRNVDLEAVKKFLT